MAALLHWLSRIWFSTFLEFEVAVFLSYFVGLIVAFVLNKVYVFPKSTVDTSAQIRRFIVVNTITLPLVWLTSLFLVKTLTFIVDMQLREAVAHGIAVALPAISSFVAYKLFAFKG